MLIGRFRFKIGSFECLAINDAADLRPITFLTNSIPQEQLAQVLKEHGFSSTEMMVDFNCLFVYTNTGLILVDTGWGKTNPQMHGRLAQSLQEEGISLRDITMVVLTHGDRDHISGMISAEGNLVFPNAQFVLGKPAWDWYTSEESLAKMPPDFTAIYRKIMPLMREQIQLIEEETKIANGIQAIPAPGHRVGHMVLHFASGNDQLLHAADVIAHPLLVEHPEWHWPADALPEQAVADRKRFTQWAADQKALVFGSHLPFPGLGRITQQEGGLRWKSVVSDEE
jgi:glyoxylase-like metal-dependent hydrolase (beta-lactamase superfamily II)